jgi:hypothetical protein
MVNEKKIDEVHYFEVVSNCNRFSNAIIGFNIHSDILKPATVQAFLFVATLICSIKTKALFLKIHSS